MQSIRLLHLTGFRNRVTLVSRMASVLYISAEVRCAGNELIDKNLSAIRFKLRLHLL